MELETMSNAECITNACRYANSSADALPPGFPLRLLVLKSASYSGSLERPPTMDKTATIVWFAFFCGLQSHKINLKQNTFEMSRTGAVRSQSRREKERPQKG